MIGAREAWTTAFLVVVFGPLVLRLVTAERQSLGAELVTVSGLLATSLLVCAVVFPSRHRSLTRAFGIETVLRGHRVIGSATAAVVLLHVIAVLVADPRSVALLVPFLSSRQPPETVVSAPLLSPLLTPPARALAGALATGCLVALAVLSARRGSGRYERWRSGHLLLALIALGGTAAHVVLIGHLIPTVQLAALLFGDPLGWVMLRSATWDPASALFLAALAVAVLGVGARRWVMWPLSAWRSRYVVTGVNRVSPTVSTVLLQPAHRGIRFRPGQFAWLRLSGDPFTEEHPFTVSSAAGGRSIEFTIRHVGDWTDLIRRLRSGDVVWLDGPHGSFTPDEQSANGLVLIAGGVGIAPMMSILRTWALAGRRSRGRQRDISLLIFDRYGLFRDELERLSGSLKLQIHELGGTSISPELLADLVPVDDRDFYVCGPPSLVTGAVTALTELDVPRYRVRTEQFDM